MSAVRRVAPRANRPYAEEAAMWHFQCLQDLGAGRHAVGCECEQEVGAYGVVFYFNACSEIVRCALEMKDYQVEVEDAQVP